MKLCVEYKTNTYLGSRRTHVFNDFFCHMYDHYKLKAHVSIWFTDFTFGEYGGDLANCGYLDDWYRPRDFHIQVSSDHIKTNRIFETLAHEFTHIEQYIRKRSILKDDRKGGLLQFWEGIDYTHMVNEMNDTKNPEIYDKLPWEIHAREAEIIGTNFYNSLPDNHKKLFSKDEPRY